MPLRVDGEVRDPGPVPPGTPLIHVLEKRLQVAGLRKRCGSHRCGGCAVLLDGEPVRACEVTWEEAEGRDVQTLSGDNSGAAS